jgi:hypothetical protein
MNEFLEERFKLSEAREAKRAATYQADVDAAAEQKLQQRLAEMTTGCLSHLDVDSDEATLGIDERDIDVGLLALVKASEGDDTDVAYVEEPDIVLEADHSCSYVLLQLCLDKLARYPKGLGNNQK